LSSAPVVPEVEADAFGAMDARGIRHDADPTVSPRARGASADTSASASTSVPQRQDSGLKNRK